MPILTVRYTPGFVSERHLLTAVREINRTLSEILNTDFEKFKGFLIPLTAQIVGEEGAIIHSSMQTQEEEETGHLPGWLTKIFGSKAAPAFSGEDERAGAERIFMLHITLEMLPGRTDQQKLNAHRAISEKVEELLQETKVAQKAVVTLHIYEFSGIFSANVVNLKGEV